MNGLPNVSFEDFMLMVKDNPVHRNMVRQHLVKTYDEFIEIFSEILDYAITRLEENPQHHQNDNEDALTEKLVTSLKMAGYDATHGTAGGGSKDLTVKWKNPQWTWIGEAKKYKSLNDVREGFLQLTTRYRTANPLYTRGALIAYTFRPKAAALLKEWMDEAANVAKDKNVLLDNFRVEDCSLRPQLAYNSFHDHVATGLPCQIRHIAVALYHLPKDKSGRSAKKYKQKNDTGLTDPSDPLQPTRVGRKKASV
ncbi:hypothetical protein [Paraburkholderia bryophila]|uniref:Restriction endonuclease n=1 Tax=Paraburkholderia bryophila TaxID=420952 RepID=A0A329CDU5_9BURK|nr:hypothetical protein [Paraburkholderia bryophila]RAS31922.1 hypothetical protein BX591_10827 [Paraburkholderia bryophila]